MDALNGTARGFVGSVSDYYAICDETFNHHATKLWNFLLENVGEWGLYTWFFWCLVVGIYALGGGFYCILDKLHLFDNYKIQQKKLPTNEEYWHCVKSMIFIYVCLILPLSFTHTLLRDLLGVQATDPIPPLKTIIMHFMIFLFTEDAFHYVLHRLFHVPFFYKHVHKVHHLHPAPFGWTAAYAHPIEVFVLAIATYGGLVFVTPHLFTFYLWIFFRELDSIEVHSGYYFPWHPQYMIPFWGGAAFHDYHHEAFNCNYASRLTYLDKLLGTYKSRNELAKLKELKKKN